ncbi:MAG TPA: tetratricopeptide repeat protein, partial [Polyangiaceae bacterium]|nr:tetratricopeptide repeat protein [Polyangiaceae bacterium]
MRGAAAALAAALVLAAGGPARANETSDRAEALFREGREAMKRGDLDEACPKFSESQELDPSAGTLLNLALCEQRKGEGARA